MHHHEADEPAQATVRVLESFGEPKATTNPYIVQLYAALRATPGLEVETFDYRTALFGEYDVVHTHWPELFMGGHRMIGRAARRALTAAMVLRWQLTRKPVVRTMHNLERPSDLARIDHLLLTAIDRLTVHDIALNNFTPARPGVPVSVIPHGHYRDWFAKYPRPDAVPGRIGYVGLIRRYKGVEDLLAAFLGWERDGVSLHIAGNPSTDDLRDGLVAEAAADPRVSFDFRFLDEPDFVAAISTAEVVVLPYKHMHNSGTALAALSLDRPVIVPDNDVNRALQAEVGAGWVHLYEGDLTTSDLDRALNAAHSPHPDLSARDWAGAGPAHLDVLRQAIGRPSRG